MYFKVTKTIENIQFCVLIIYFIVFCLHKIHFFILPFENKKIYLGLCTPDYDCVTGKISYRSTENLIQSFSHKI